MATNIEVNELRINKMSEETLRTMESSGQILPNQIFFTDDSDDTMVNVEQVEVVYDMNDSNKDWGYSSGIVGGITLTKDLSKYKKIKITPKFFYANSVDTGGISQVLEMNVRTIVNPSDNWCVGTWSARYIAGAVTSVGGADFGMSCYYNVSTYSLQFHFSYNSGNTDNNERYAIVRIEGVY